MIKKQRFYRYFFITLMTAALLQLIGCGSAPHKLKVETPSHGNVKFIIFRMDDAVKGAHEEVVEQIIMLFEKNHAPLDVAVIPYSNGIASYDMPFLKKYLDAGVINISMHGCEHTLMEFDTSQSGKSYRELKADLIKAREQFNNYFGITPVAFAVPYDHFNEEGYRAIQDAGFKIFSSQDEKEKHPSLVPVDYHGNKDENGMARLCALNDVAYWDSVTKKWGEIYSADLNNDLFYGVKLKLNVLGVAVISVHPQAFVDENNVIDHKKLGKLDKIIKLCRRLGKITTFEKLD